MLGAACHRKPTLICGQQSLLLSGDVRGLDPWEGALPLPASLPTDGGKTGAGLLSAGQPVNQGWALGLQGWPCKPAEVSAAGTSRYVPCQTGIAERHMGIEELAELVAKNMSGVAFG